MTMKRMLMAVSLACLPAPGWALGPMDLGVSVGGWQADLAGDISKDGENIDVENDLNLDEETMGFLRGRLHVMGLGNWYVGYTPLEYEGTGTMTRTVSFGNQTFSAASTVSSDIDLDTYDVGWTFTAVNAVAAQLELGAQAKWVDGAITLRSGGQREKADLSIPVPMLKAVVRGSVALVDLELDASGISYGSNHFYELTGLAKFNPVPVFHVAAGYRFADVQLEDGDTNADLQTGGPLLAVGMDL